MKNDIRNITHEILMNEFGFGFDKGLLQNEEGNIYSKNIYSLNDVTGCFLNGKFYLENKNFDTVQDLKNFLKDKNIPSNFNDHDPLH